MKKTYISIISGITFALVAFLGATAFYHYIIYPIRFEGDVKDLRSTHDKVLNLERNNCNKEIRLEEMINQRKLELLNQRMLDTIEWVRVEEENFFEKKLSNFQLKINKTFRQLNQRNSQLKLRKDSMQSTCEAQIDSLQQVIEKYRQKMNSGQLNRVKKTSQKLGLGFFSNEDFIFGLNRELAENPPDLSIGVVIFLLIFFICFLGLLWIREHSIKN